MAVFLGVVLPLRRLGSARSLFFRAAREQRDELVREVEMAAAVQRQLLDQHRPPAGPLDVVARTEPAKVVGGDYYDFVPLSDGRLAVVIADVSGKGLPAALIMPAVKIALRTLAERHADSGRPARRTQPDLPRQPAAGLLLHADLRRLRRGRGAPRLRERRAPSRAAAAASGAAEWLDGRGRRRWGCSTATSTSRRSELRFEPGDVFVFYTDGITEAADAAGREFGQDRIVEAARGAAGRSAAAVVAAVHAAADAFRGGAARGDDATVIAVRVPAAD